MSVSLIAVDVDGTLLASDGSITEETKNAFRDAAAHGICPVLNTGRSRNECSHILARLPELRYMINCSGASVYDIRQEKELYVEGLPMDLVRDLHRAVSDMECLFELLADGHIYTDTGRLSHLPEYQSPAYIIELVQTTRTSVDMAQMLRTRTEPVAKVHLLFRCPEEQQEGRRRLEPFGIPIISSLPGNLELNLPTVDKGLGLHRLCAHLGIKTADCMAIGDNYNDLGMLKEAGYPVAMGNAEEETVRCAKYRTASCDENGVAVAIRHVLDGTLDQLRKE